VPTRGVAASFWRDWEQLTDEQRELFLQMIPKFVDDLRSGSFRGGLRVKGLKGARGVFEVTWAPDGRATFAFGRERKAGEPHVIWRRVGTHDVLRNP